MHILLFLEKHINLYLDHQQFLTAKDNMAYDRQLLETVSNQRIFRIYLWQQPSVTFSYKQSIPDPLKTIDHAQRITGGGIVFHSSGDVLFTVVSWLQDHFFETGLKQKMAKIRAMIQSAFEPLSIALVPDSPLKPINQDIRFCQTYHNPDELYYNHHKVVGMTIRKYRDRFIIQGIIHITDISKETTSQIDPEKVVMNFKKQLK